MGDVCTAVGDAVVSWFRCRFATVDDTSRETKIASELFDANPEFYGSSFVVGL